MWWANGLWTNTATYGDVVKPLEKDHKSRAWNELANATEIMLLIHTQGKLVGWKSFQKVDGKTMYQHLQGGDNTKIGSKVLASKITSIWTSERLVRSSTELYANHCVQSGGACTTGTSGSPDGDRIGSHQAVPKDNSGGGLGNWHDMGLCCSGTYGPKRCNGAYFRTCSEAQADWGGYSGYGSAGTFGTDSCAKMTNGTSGCANAVWAKANQYAYDYAIFLK